MLDLRLQVVEAEEDDLPMVVKPCQSLVLGAQLCLIVCPLRDC